MNGKQKERIGGTVDGERIVLDDFGRGSLGFEGFQGADRRRSHPTKHLSGTMLVMKAFFA